MLARVVWLLGILGVCSAACGAPTDPTDSSWTTPPATVDVVEPAAGAMLISGNQFKITYTVRYARGGATQHAVAFVRDDGAYSKPIACGSSLAGGGTGNGFEIQTVNGVVGTDRIGNILYEFAKGRRVSAMVVLLRLQVPFGPVCEPLATEFNPSPTEGAVFPERADRRVDTTLNWFIQP